ncbi:MAG: fumarylacetoacetate hydrolase family protein [Akkermansiaceae bacterium]|jgi:2,4-diketo-3-deoxy-L-fuconate hydrolase|tara:strand:- start:1649 stop:2506 length:858 start_codon:yes stop_codon:yes gene_type:complete
MKLTRFQTDGTPTPGLFLDDNTILNASSFGEDWNEAFFDNNGLARLADWLDQNRESAPTMQASEVTLAPAVARPSKLLCIGLNYAAHAAEGGVDPPAEPVLFSKATSAWSGPNDDLLIPRESEKTDWEVELALVIGKHAKYVAEEDAMDYIAGFAVHNDYSERAWQLEGTGQWVKGKSADTYAPFGPYLATTDEIADPGNLHLWLKRNGEMMQDSNTNDLIFNIPHLVSYVSRFMSLLPGDVISTGTPAGVGLGFKPPVFVQPGDVFELGVDGLGTQRQVAVKEA